MDMEQAKRDRQPAVPISRVRTGRHYTGGGAAYRRREGETTFVQGLAFRCILALLIFLVFCLAWWLDTSSGQTTRGWLRTAVTQELPESGAYKQVQEWNQAIGKGAKGAVDWFRSLFAPGSAQGDAIS
jgi:hypothetical protein